jgi:hypothetical protein
MPLVTQGLVNQLDAQYVQNSGQFVDGQNIVGAFLPDTVDSAGWYGIDGYDCILKYDALYDKPAFRFKTGVLTPRNILNYLNYTNLTVLICARRGGPAWNNTWMGLYSSWYNYNRCGATILAITDNNNDLSFTNWGTYGGTVTTQSTSAMELDKPYVISSTFTSANSGEFYTNSTLTGNFSLTKDQGYFGVGGLLPAKGSFVGDIFEVLVYNRILTTLEIQESSQYLINKWFFPSPSPTPTPTVTPTNTTTPTTTPTPSTTTTLTPTPSPTSTTTPTPTTT